MIQQRETRFRPSFDVLESRETPAVTVTAFASTPGGPADSYLIKGTKNIDLIHVSDDPGGLGFSVLSGVTPLTLPTIASPNQPVIVRVSLGDGNDTLEYLVPIIGTVLKRKIEYTGGNGVNDFAFARDSAFNGVNLGAGSVVGIEYDGELGRVASFRIQVEAMNASVFSVDAAFGALNDKGINLAFQGVNGDSSVSGCIDLGSGSTDGSFSNPANEVGIEIGSNIGSGDVVGSTLDLTVLGGAKTDVVDVFTTFLNMGNGSGTPARASIDVNLGGRPDEFVLQQFSTSTLNDNAAFAVTVHGGAGNDRLIAANNEGISGGLLTLDPGALFDLNFYGDAGNDETILYYDITAGALAFGANSTFRVRLFGNAGDDRLELFVNNTVGSDTTGVYDIQAIGAGGDDLIATMSILDLSSSVNFRGGLALVDGGLGTNTALFTPTTNFFSINVDLP